MGPKVSGGMTSAEVQAMLDRQNADLENKIKQQTDASVAMAEKQAQLDEMQARREAQRAAAEEAAIEQSQKRLELEIKLQDEALSEEEKQQLQNSYNSLFQSLVTGMGGADGN